MHCGPDLWYNQLIGYTNKFISLTNHEIHLDVEKIKKKGTQKYLIKSPQPLKCCLKTNAITKVTFLLGE